MEEILFREIDDIKEYVTSQLENGTMEKGLYCKSAQITARVGIEGEKITTVMADGLKETVNTVSKDSDGNSDWVVTNPDGEEYIVKHSAFISRYEKIEGSENRFRPIPKPVVAASVNESISFTAPWGEKMNLASGGFLIITDLDDIYGVQQREFLSTYEKL